MLDTSMASEADLDQHLSEEIPEGFSLNLANFSGPLDLLLSLIARRRMDVTEVALAEVTDEFLIYVRSLENSEKALEQSTSFMVVAATLLDLKTAQLLPAGISDPEAELALLEARDLLFARLLQYKAFKEAAGMLQERMEEESRSVPRRVAMEPQWSSVLPELVWTLNAKQFGELAHEVFSRPREHAVPTVGIDHLHAPLVSVREQASLMARWLQQQQKLTFSQLVADAESTMVVVARFLGLLDLYRDRVIDFEQQQPLQQIVVIWSTNATSETTSQEGSDERIVLHEG